MDEIHEDFEIGNFTGMDDYSATNGWVRSGDSLSVRWHRDVFDGYAIEQESIDHNESSSMDF